MAALVTRKSGVQARVRLLGHPEYSETFPTKTAAKKWATKVELALKESKPVPTREQKRRTVADLINRYIDDCLPHKPNNKDARKVAQRLGWWREQIGSYGLANIKAPHIARARDRLRQEHKGLTCNRYLAALSHVFKIGVEEWHSLEESPMRKVGRFPKSLGRTRASASQTSIFIQWLY